MKEVISLCFILLLMIPIIVSNINKHFVSNDTEELDKNLKITDLKDTEEVYKNLQIADLKYHYVHSDSDGSFYFYTNQKLDIDKATFTLEGDGITTETTKIYSGYDNCSDKVFNFSYETADFKLYPGNYRIKIDLAGKEFIYKHFYEPVQISNLKYHIESPARCYFTFKTDKELKVDRLTFTVDRNIHIYETPKIQFYKHKNSYFVYKVTGIERFYPDQSYSVKIDLDGQNILYKEILVKPDYPDYFLFFRDHWDSPVRPRIDFAIKNTDRYFDEHQPLYNRDYNYKYGWRTMLKDQTVNFSYRVAGKKYKTAVVKANCSEYVNKECPPYSIVALEDLPPDTDVDLYLDKGAKTKTGKILPEIKIKKLHTFGDFKYLGYRDGQIFFSTPLSIASKPNHLFRFIRKNFVFYRRAGLVDLGGGFCYWTDSQYTLGFTKVHNENNKYIDYVDYEDAYFMPVCVGTLGENKNPTVNAPYFIDFNYDPAKYDKVLMLGTVTDIFGRKLRNIRIRNRIEKW